MPVPLHPRGVHADPRRLAGLTIVDEDILPAVRVAGDEVGGRALERDQAAVGRDRRADAVPVPLNPRGGHADPRRLAGLTVVDEDIHEPIRVAADEVAGVALERDQAAVGRD